MTQRLNYSTPINGDKTKFFGRLFIYSNGTWLLNELCQNVISKKNSGSNKLYYPHPVTK